MEPGTLYVIGPGTSAGAVMRAAGHAPTILGIDALRDGRWWRGMRGRTT
jgi:hypothetical protein